MLLRQHRNASSTRLYACLRELEGRAAAVEAGETGAEATDEDDEEGAEGRRVMRDYVKRVRRKLGVAAVQ